MVPRGAGWFGVSLSAKADPTLKGCRGARPSWRYSSQPKGRPKAAKVPRSRG